MLFINRAIKAIRVFSLIVLPIATLIKVTAQVHRRVRVDLDTMETIALNFRVLGTAMAKVNASIPARVNVIEVGQTLHFVSNVRQTFLALVVYHSLLCIQPFHFW